MAKIACNHCKSKFIYKSKISKHFDKSHICDQYNIKKIDGEYYCQPCMRTISGHISKGLIIEEARKHGMKMPSESIPTPVINIKRKEGPKERILKDHKKRPKAHTKVKWAKKTK